MKPQAALATLVSRGPSTPLDRWTLGYAVVAGAAVVLRWPEAHVAIFLAAHALLIVLVLLLPRARQAGPLGQLLGEWYPLLIVTALYTAVGLVNVGDGRSYDRLVQGWEQALFASQPSRDWIRRSPSPWIAWVLYLGYLSYYAILVGAPLALWTTGRRAAMRRVVTRLMATFYVCYVAFLVFPVVGPRHAFPPADNPATQTIVARAAESLLDRLAAWGAAFPSSHVAVSVTATLAALAEWRPLGYALLAPTVLLILGSVYGQFHYAVDVLAGLGVAGVVIVSSLIPLGWGARRSAPAADVVAASRESE